MKRYRNLLASLLFMAFAAACLPAPVGPGGTATGTAASPADQPATPAATLSPEPAASAESSTPPGQPPASGPRFIAYVRDGQLLVTEVTDGVQGGTTQYTVAGESDQVIDLVWSPSGEYIAFVSPAQGELHLFYVFALGQSTPVDLGPGSAPAWSPDSQFLAYVRGVYPDDNIWITAIENPAPRQLSFDTDHAWGRPAFTPDGSALIVAGADRLDLGAQGNTSFVLERLELDGSGTHTALPGAALFEGGRLPYDLRFSPDGSRLAFSSSFHLSACASPGAYYVSSADGGNRQELISPSLRAETDPSLEHYHVGLSYDWHPAGDALVVLGNVVDCDIYSPAPGRSLAGPQISIVGLDGSERLVIPGLFHGLSMDRTGTLIAAAHYRNNQDLNPMVEIYSAQTGQLVLPLGPGSTAQFQP